MDTLAHAQKFIEHGQWAIFHSFDTNKSEPPSFYTCGLTSLGLPELFFSMDIPVEDGSRLLNNVAHLMLMRKDLNTSFNGFDDELISVGHHDPFMAKNMRSDALYNHMPVVMEYYNGESRGTQLVWRDQSGNYPWDNKGVFQHGAEGLQLIGYAQ